MRRAKVLERVALEKLLGRIQAQDALRKQYQKKPLEFLGRYGSRYMGPMKEMFEDIYHGRIDSAVGLACRGGGKTKGVAELGVCEWLLPEEGWNVFVVSGSLDQAMCTLEYVQEITGDEEVQDLVENETKTLVKGKDGNWIRAVAASTKAVRGPHARGRKILLILDEEAEMHADVVRAALNIGNDAERFVVVRISTMHKLTGTFKELVDRHKQMGYKLYRWDSFDVARNCTTKNCKNCLAAFRKGNPPELIEKLTEEFHEYCKERPKQKGRTEGWIKVETIRRKFFELPLSWFLSEVMALEPSGEGMVLPYKLVKALFESKPRVSFLRGAPIWGWVDWGFKGEMTAGVNQQQGNITAVLNAAVWSGVNIEMLISWFRGYEQEYGQKLDEINPDSSHPFENNRMREEGWEVNEAVFGAFKETGAGYLKWLLERDRYRLSNLPPEVEEEMRDQMMGWARGADGKIKKGFDHFCDGQLAGMKRLAGQTEGTMKATTWDRRAGKRFFRQARERRAERLKN